ncbi:MAG: fused MFS/spermidine synthase, partial [bacterium]
RPWLMAHIGNGTYPALEVLLCVLAFAGLPYVLLSANSTLVQAWVSRREEGSEEHPMSHVSRPKSDVYSLYAVSNAGSLLGLLCYPFLVEPFLSLNVQWYGFAGALGVYAGLLGWLSKGLVGTEGTDGTEGTEERSTLNAKRSTSNEEIIKGNQAMLLWLLLPATSTFLLNAVTAHLSTDVTPIPLLWVALLAAFLVSYIIGFSKLGEKGVWVWCVVAMIPLVFCAYATGLKGGRGFLFNLIPGILLVLLGSAFLHSWLYRIRPGARLLTRFYLCIAAGGAMGGILSGIVAPLVFTSVIEYPIVLVTLAAFLAFYVWRNTPKEFRWVEVATQVVALAVVYFVVVNQFKKEPGQTGMMLTRNFYGCLTVSSQELKAQYSDTVQVHQIKHGETLHGVQFQPHYLRERPTTYYGAFGGGLSVMTHPSYTNGTPMSVGLIGLGAGTMASWGRTNDTYRFFEINPKVVNIAWNTNYFTYLSGCKANLSVALGDARRVIAAETNRYDVLVIDAYSGDSIPFHLATKEAFRLYLDRLNPGGILAVHISNWHIDLNPLCKAVAKEWGLQLTGVISQPQGICTGANWVFIGDRRLSLQGLLCLREYDYGGQAVRETDWDQVRDIALPTDTCGSLINLVRYGHRPPEKQREIDLRSLFQ